MGDPMRAARVIAAFPATGKTYMAATVPGVADSDSSRFSWKYSHPDVRERHPDWPGNYIAHLRELLRSSLRYVLVSTHAEVRDALVANGIDFTLVYPADDCREEYRERMRRRGSPEALIRRVIDELWSQAIAECEQQRGCLHVMLARGEYLAEALSSQPVAPADEAICGRILVGLGSDTFDPLCALPVGHCGVCRVAPADEREWEWRVAAWDDDEVEPDELGVFGNRDAAHAFAVVAPSASEPPYQHVRVERRLRAGEWEAAE